ncbi:MAG: YARHG domain-containing protein [Lachnospiraceae bacterium]
MRKKIMLFILLFCCTFISACNNLSNTNNDILSNNTDDFQTDSPNQTSDSNVQNADYQKYSGYWSTNGQSNEDIMKNGGTEFHIEIVNGNEINGYLYSQQGTSERFAEINDIKGTVTDGECSYSFTDDGWGNSGTLFIHLNDDEITIEVKDFIMSEENTSGYGISGSYNLIPMIDSITVAETESISDESNLPDTTLQKYSSNWQESQVLEELEKRKAYTDSCSFYPEYLQFMENVREVRDISMYIESLYATDTKYYQISDFDDVPPLIIYLAKNEIYARHGYTFKDTDLNYFFLSQLWYLPEVDSKEFDVAVFNEYETANLQLLAQLDTYK